MFLRPRVVRPSWPHGVASSLLAVRAVGRLRRIEKYAKRAVTFSCCILYTYCIKRDGCSTRAYHRVVYNTERRLRSDGARERFTSRPPPPGNDAPLRGRRERPELKFRFSAPDDRRRHPFFLPCVRRPHPLALSRACITFVKRRDVGARCFFFFLHAHTTLCVLL